MASGRPVFGRKRSWPPSAISSVADLVGAGVLPDDGVVDGLAGGPVPHHRGLALVGDADRGEVVLARCRPTSSASPTTSSVRLQISAGSCSTQPGFGKICSCSFWAIETTRAAVVEDHEAGAGGPLVDRAYVLSPRHRLRSVAVTPHVRAAHRTQEGARCRARVLVARAALAEVARAALARDERDRGPGALLRRVGAPGRAPSAKDAPLRERARAAPSAAGMERVHHGLVARLGLAARPHAGDGRPRGTPPSPPGVRAAPSPAAEPNCRKSVPYSGPAAPPTFEIRVIPTELHQRRDVGRLRRRRASATTAACRGPC